MPVIVVVNVKLINVVIVTVVIVVDDDIVVVDHDIIRMVSIVLIQTNGSIRSEMRPIQLRNADVAKRAAYPLSTAAYLADHRGTFLAQRFP